MEADGISFSSIADYAERYRSNGASIHAAGTAQTLREALCLELNDKPLDGTEVIRQLTEAVEPGLVRNTDPGFFGWVMGASDPVGVAADWLTSIWGQNSAIYQTAPASAIAEEAVSAWLLDLLHLPEESSVAFVTGATMAGFVGLAAARSEVLRRSGHDFDAQGLQGAPTVRIFVSDDTHVSNLAALRYLGFGQSNIVSVPSDNHGLINTADLSAALSAHDGPRIIISQAGHINSGGFEDYVALSDLSKQYDAWLHVDGAFGLWARILPEKEHLTKGLECADSWSVDGHKWLQLPYDSGFAIVRDEAAHIRAMAKEAGYFNRNPNDGRNPTQFNPELSRRARSFAAWAVIRHHGREGIANIVRNHCAAAARLATELKDVSDFSVLDPVDLNQVILMSDDPQRDYTISELATRINSDQRFFVRTAQWKSRTVLRISIISQHADENLIVRLAERIRRECKQLENC
ncbi:MAG: pyridoxal-dependent decarboxylase [Pseudomonadota bacterium]